MENYLNAIAGYAGAIFVVAVAGRKIRQWWDRHHSAQRSFPMVYANTAALPLSEEVLELMQAHQNLVVGYDALTVREEDAYSLAQPSPLKYVPSVASGSVSADLLGE